MYRIYILLRPTNPDPEGIPRMSEKQGIPKEINIFVISGDPLKSSPPSTPPPLFLIY